MPTETGNDSGESPLAVPDGGDNEGTGGIISGSLVGKLFTGLFLILLLSGITAGFFLFNMNGQLEDQVNTQVRETSNLQSDIYEGWIDDRYQELETVGSDATLNTDDRGVQGSFLDSEVTRSDDFQSLHIVSLESGEVLASSVDGVQGEQLIDRIGDDSVSATEFVTSLQYESLRGETVVGIGEPLGTRANEILVGEVDAEEGGPNIRQTTEGSTTVVVNEAGEPVFGSESVDTGLFETGSDQTVVNSQGDSIYGSTALQSGLYMVTETPSGEAFAIRNSILQSFIITLILTFAILSVVIGAGGRSIGNSMTTLANKAEQMKSGDLSVEMSTDRSDEIGSLYRSFAEMRDALREQIDESERARKEAEVARAEAEELAEYLQNRTEEYSEIMQQVGAGDLTKRMEPDGQEESMDQIAEEFNEMIAELEKTTGQLQSYVDEVEKAGEDVEQSADTITKASEQVADSIQLISDDSYDQKEQLEEIHDTMADLTVEIERIADQTEVDIDEPLEQINQIADDVGELLDTVEKTMAESQQVAGAAEEQAAELNEVSERANELQRYAEPLRDILDRFTTEDEHEFVFSVGPTGGNQTPSQRSDGS